MRLIGMCPSMAMGARVLTDSFSVKLFRGVSSSLPVRSKLISNVFSRYLTQNRAGDGAKAHELSVQGKAHQRTQDQLDDQASAWIFNGKQYRGSCHFYYKF